MNFEKQSYQGILNNTMKKTVLLSQMSQFQTCFHLRCPIGVGVGMIRRAVGWGVWGGVGAENEWMRILLKVFGEHTVATEKTSCKKTRP